MRLGLITSGFFAMLLLASPCRAEQRWQCGDGLSVSLTGSRADREAACHDAKEQQAKAPDEPISEEQAAHLRKQIKDAEKQYDVDIKVDGFDENQK